MYNTVKFMRITDLEKFCSEKEKEISVKYYEGRLDVKEAFRMTSIIDDIRKFIDENLQEVTF